MGENIQHNQQSKQMEVPYGLPREVKYCTKCVISNQRPRAKKSEFTHTSGSTTDTIDFDEEGVCAACRYHDQKRTEIDWEEREKLLWDLCDKYRKSDGSHDCIVSGSGGKDSVMVAHLLKYKFKMNPLTVTWAPHMYTEVGWRNMQHWIDAGFDNILFHPNGKVHKLLTRLAFENLLHPFQPFILGQKNLAPKTAAKFDIPLVFYGEPGVEYGDPGSDGAQRKKHYHTGANYEEMCLGGAPIKDLIEKYGASMTDLKAYLPIDPEEYDRKGIQVHYLGWYVRWDPQEAYYYAVKNIGFEANTERTEGSYSKYSSIDDKSDPFHYFTQLIKFGIGRATYDAAQECRNNKITREEAVVLVKKFDQEFPKKYFQEFLEYMGITEERFWECIEKFRNENLWEFFDGAWKLKKPVWAENNQNTKE